MKINIKILSIILLILSVLGGFFYFISRDNEKIVIESNNLAKEVISEEKISESEAILEDKEKEIDAQELEKEEIQDKSIEIKQENSESDKKQEKELKIDKKFVFWGFEKAKGRKIDTIILHTSYNILGGDQYDLEKVIEEYKDYEVAPHYVIDRKGNTYNLVEDKNIAYHAGESTVPDGRSGVNGFSLGIEVLNNKEDKFTKEQYQSINTLIRYLKNNYEIKYILGHNQISPGRKTDPWNIDWSKIEK